MTGGRDAVFTGPSGCSAALCPWHPSRWLGQPDGLPFLPRAAPARDSEEGRAAAGLATLVVYVCVGRIAPRTVRAAPPSVYCIRVRGGGD